MSEGFWSDTGVLVGGGVALFIFFALFIGMLVWIFRPGSRREYQRRARLPLDDGTDSRGHNGAS